MQKFRSWAQIESVLAVAQAGSYRAAANQLGITSSTVARHIETISKEVGHQLFLPAGSGWTLTDAGKELVAIATNAQTDLGFMLKRLGSTEGQSFSVTLNTISFIVADFLAPALSKWREANPGARLTIEANDHNAAIERGEADVALRLTRPETVGGSRFKLANCYVGLYSTNGKSGPSWIGLPDEYGVLPEVKAATALTGREPSVRLDSLHAIARAAVDSGLPGIMPSCVARNYPELKLAVDENGQRVMIHRELWFLFYGMRKEDPAIAAVKKWVKQVFPSPTRCLCGHCTPPA